MQSTDVELVEPEAVLVKEEKVEANTSRVEEMEEDVQLIGDDGEYTIKNQNFLSAAPTECLRSSQLLKMNVYSDSSLLLHSSFKEGLH